MLAAKTSKPSVSFVEPEKTPTSASENENDTLWRTTSTRTVETTASEDFKDALNNEEKEEESEGIEVVKKVVKEGEKEGEKGVDLDMSLIDEAAYADAIESPTSNVPVVNKGTLYM